MMRYAIYVVAAAVVFGGLILGVHLLTCRHERTFARDRPEEFLRSQQYNLVPRESKFASVFIDHINLGNILSGRELGERNLKSERRDTGRDVASFDTRSGGDE